MTEHRAGRRASGGTIRLMKHTDDTDDVAGPHSSYDVLVDRAGRVGLLSYLPPENGASLRVGDGVLIPFGAATRSGTVVAASRDPRAVRPILGRTVRRSGPAEIQVARQLAELHLSEFIRTAVRLSPTKGTDDPPLDAGPLEPADSIAGSEPIRISSRDSSRKRWLLLRAPLVDPHRLAAEEAMRLHEETGKQILILCPTVKAVSATVANFVSGAARLDARALAGAWAGFAGGTIPVAVGTRTAALWRPKRLGGIIIVDDEHPGHVESSQPYTHARDIAAQRTSASRCALTIISACPDAAALGASVKLASAGSRSDWPRTIVLDRGQISPSERLVPPRLRSELNTAERNGHRAVVLAERRAATLRCRQCRALWPCTVDDCQPSYCRHTPERACVACGTRTRISVGFDKERLGALLPQARPVSLAELSSTRDAGLVIVFDISPATRAAEWAPGTLASRLIVTAAQAAGPNGTMIICSWDRPDGVVSALGRQHDQTAVARMLWDQARRDRLPPFGHVVTIWTSRTHGPRTDGWPGVVYGPRRMSNGQWETVVTCDSGGLAQLTGHVTKLRRNGKVRVKVL